MTPDYRQTLNILPLAFGAAPTEHRRTIGQSLVDDIEGRTAGHLDCGSIGSKHLLPVLDSLGRTDLAITVATEPSPPGWASWFHQGDRTLRESWDPSARSRNHYFLGAVSAWFHERIGALRATAAGWSTFEVAPVDDPRISWGRASHETVHGRASTAWRRDRERWTLEVTVPNGSSAQVRLPGRIADELPPGTHTIEG